MIRKATSNLGAAIEELYRAFARYPLRERVEGCPHCVSDADNDVIHSARLRDLTDAQLERFAFKAMTTWGTADDFRHFLPRIFELIALQGEASAIGPETAFGKLSYGNWSSWPMPEREAIRAFFQALWRDVLSRFPHSFRIESCLCAIGQAEEDLSGYLYAWSITGSLPAAMHFADYVDANASNIHRKRAWRLANAFWHGRNAQSRQVTEWFLDPKRLAEMEEAFHRYSGESTEAATMLSDGVSKLAWIAPRVVAICDDSGVISEDRGRRAQTPHPALSPSTGRGEEKLTLPRAGGPGAFGGGFR
jgi:hypothetical protein